MSEVRTRFAPSPTGYLHIGGARTALFNWLFARHHRGSFVLRIEDTDRERSSPESTRAILEAMRWLGLDWDEGPFFQAERQDLYRNYLEKLIEKGLAYYCECSPTDLEEKRQAALASGKKPKYDGRCRNKELGYAKGRVARFCCPSAGETIVSDALKGAITFRNEELDDLVLLRSDGFPTYNFAVVVDDAEMRITHVIRGDDHLNNTPRQILLYHALGFPLPVFCHVPMILGADKARLSKRHGATAVGAYREMGYLPQALVNYLVRLGWSHRDQEIFSLSELIDLFDLDALGNSAAVFNPDKLLWLNQHYLKATPPQDLQYLLREFLAREGIDAPDMPLLESVCPALAARSRTLVEMAQNGKFYFQEQITYEREAAQSFLTPQSAPFIAAGASRLANLDDYNRAEIETALRSLAEHLGIKLKELVQPLRVALTGKVVSPGIDEVMLALGKEKTLQRLDDALLFIKNTLEKTATPEN